MAGMTETDADAKWLAFDAVEIDTAGRRLWVNRVEVSLEPKAFDALVLLVERAGRVCTRDELLDAVWSHRHITPSVLSRVITMLRHALGEQGDEPRYLHTVHGIGYRFDADVRAVPRARAREDRGAVAAEVSVPDASRSVDEAPLAVAIPADAKDADAAPPAPARTRKPSVAALLLLFALLAFAGWKLWPWTQSAATTDAAAATEQRSIAVLPLVNTDGSAPQFLSDGLSEDLIIMLSQFEGLKVISRSSSFHFRDSKEDSKAIGAKLGVGHLIEGSVQRIGDDVRIGIQLVRTADGSTLWTQRFDRTYKDLFALQDEIALAVTGALQIKLLHSMPSAIETGRPASGNLEAYNAYLRGTYYMGGQDMRRAIEQFAEATRLDPNYAQAWSWLGFWRTQFARYSLNGDEARAAYKQARQEIETALKLTPNYGHAHAHYANWLSTAEYDWNGALAEFRTALSLVPDNDPTHGAISRLQTTLGKIEDATRERRKYIDGDPLAGFARVFLAELQADMGRLDEAEASLREAVEIAPNDADWYASERSYLAILRGDAATALAEATRMRPDDRRDRALALAAQIGNDRAAADAALQHLIDVEGQAKSNTYAIARVHALRGNADKTFEWLQRDWDGRGTAVYSALADPLLLRFRDDPRFAEYCRKAGLPPPSESEALGIDQIRAANATNH
ncbi:MAG TPA: winged helix-turn-helix domain-containing protein [Rudaea sp.]|jgi:TolB-like protein/DNA-binding winged helix-turn-helix (wHTH) protein|uniref:winged helix-turn-helix domain-containing tetratricopeptide repeat protein n=1 Tax=Rudaea sp. TaxID=2136325 RepID=UPI002F94DB3D